MITFTDAASIIALFWTIFQQYKINTMCYKCPLRTEKTGLNNPSKSF